MCAFTAPLLARTKSTRRSDLWLWYRFELHSKHNSTFSYYIVHFLCHSDCYFCLSFFGQSQSLSFWFNSTPYTSSVHRRYWVSSYFFNFFFILRSTFRFFGHSSSSSLFDSIPSVCSRFFSLFGFFFCLKTAHKLFCECEPNDIEKERKKRTHQQRLEHSTRWKWKRRSRRKKNANWSSLVECARSKEEEGSQNKFKNILLLLRDFPPFEYFVSIVLFVLS